MFGIRTVAGGLASRRAFSSLALAATMLLSAPGVSVPASAQAPSVQDGAVAGRVRIVIKSVKIFDDRDGLLTGDGEMRFLAALVCQTAAAEPCPEYDNGTLDSFSTEFSAGSGDTKTLDLPLPLSSSWIPGFPRKSSNPDASPETGYVLRSGRTYQLRFAMYEKDDLTFNEHMGVQTNELTYENRWAMGESVERSVRPDSGTPGDFEVAFQILPMPFPDLRVTGVKVHDLTSSPNKRICTTAKNTSAVDASAFEVSLRVDGTVPADGRVTAPGLAAGLTGEWCVETELPVVGERQLEAVVDDANALIELDDSDNTFKQAYTPSQVTATPVPSQSTARGAALADLTVGAIKVNGQAPDGKDDCKDGKNVVTVAVKNAGTANAENIAVRLLIDGAEKDAPEQTVKELAAGKEQEVRFGDVKLKKGEHKIAATVDPKSTIAEANEGNNTLEVSARCSGAD